MPWLLGAEKLVGGRVRGSESGGFEAAIELKWYWNLSIGRVTLGM
jgi:hypothetical protein